MAWALVALCAALLMLLAHVARSLPPPVRFIIWVQVAYWLVSYVLRPILLLAVEPSPSPGDNIADFRLWAPSYSETLPDVLEVVAMGIAIYTLVIWTAGLTRMRHLGRAHEPPAVPEPFLFFWFVGWSLRLFTEFVVDGRSGILETLSLLAIVGSSGAIVFYNSGRSRIRSLWTIVVIVGGEAVWSLVTTSKTPLLAAALALVLRFVMLGWSRRATWITVAAGTLLALSFSTFQALHLGDESTRQFDAALEAKYPSELRVPLYVLNRFDLLKAVTDATQFPVGSYGWDQTLSRAWDALLPSLLVGEKVTTGKAWNLEVRSQSIPYAGLSDVSLGEGFIAEGYAYGGFLGLLLEAVFLALVTFFVASLLLSRESFKLYWGLLLMSFPTLFERGALGIMELLSKSIQVALIAGVLAYVHRSVVNKRVPGRRHGSSLVSSGSERDRW